MATELIPSSFRCDCGEELDFSEGTLTSMKKISMHKEQRLSEGNHRIVFYEGKAIKIECPELGDCPITGWE